MKNYKNIIIKAFVLIIVFGIGAIAGGYLGIKYVGKPMKYVNTVATLYYASEHAHLQYLNADYAAAKEATLSFIKFLDDLKTKGWPENRTDQYLYYVDSGIAYARIAVLEEKAGNVGEKQKAMEEARKKFQVAGWKDYSEGKILEFLERIDRMKEFQEKAKSDSGS